MATGIQKSMLSFGRLTVYATLLFFLVFYGLPLIWLFFAATKSETSLVSLHPLLPGSWEALSSTWNDLTSYNDFQLASWALNSLIYSVGGVSVSLFTCIPAGYVLAVYDFPGRTTILILTLISLLTPAAAVALPIFLEMRLLGLNNTMWGLILATGYFPFGVYLAYVYFSSSLPNGVLDSGRVDGCNSFQLFTRIVLPLAKPVIALVAFFSFLANWSNYFLAFVLLSDDKLYNLPVGLAALVSGSGALTNITTNDIPIRKPEVLLASILVVLPVLVVFLGAQRFVRAGLLTGAEKG